MSDESALAARVTELETRLEFQDETIGRLNDELVVHQQKIATLERMLDKVVARLQSGPDELPDADPSKEPPPPHY